MLKATAVIPASRWPASERRATVTLAHHDRHRRRIRLAADDGTAFLLDLAEATVLRHGDGLKLEDGSGYIEVQAAPEPLVEVRAATPQLLARLAWHLGNRHLPAEIHGDRILIRDDHVIVDMLKGLGAEVRPTEAPFDPEGGAYGQHNRDPTHPYGLGSRYGKPGNDRGHDHSHHHSHDHSHSHSHDHGHHHHHSHDHEH
ncbi:urease accessory protein UreE [uncultured Ferrovibrio sp.]|uniref:urease accessory protein UreE n=1 Tax=uncultured Ferrovibrio sp. TaxID=1576913 RepID=UPI00263806C2|nr:urease accessory protein UreE [uncultured Ferrovibrio sp.]